MACSETPSCTLNKYLLTGWLCENRILEKPQIQVPFPMRFLSNGFPGWDQGKTRFSSAAHRPGSEQPERPRRCGEGCGLGLSEQPLRGRLPQQTPLYKTSNARSTPGRQGNKNCSSVGEFQIWKRNQLPSVWEEKVGHCLPSVQWRPQALKGKEELCDLWRHRLWASLVTLNFMRTACSTSPHL